MLCKICGLCKLRGPLATQGFHLTFALRKILWQHPGNPVHLTAACLRGHQPRARRVTKPRSFTYRPARDGQHGKMTQQRSSMHGPTGPPSNWVCPPSVSEYKTDPSYKGKLKQESSAAGAASKSPSMGRKRRVMAIDSGSQAAPPVKRSNPDLQAAALCGIGAADAAGVFAWRLML
ncbi:hypothetical protein WJX72_006595 [[Myrmecia] bisecta]|uniref:Uncharacterized protein n=1 Tax=[Myrmecia] bisecta TaxID=41462 RepID=A0AAW1R709_9CHLO